MQQLVALERHAASGGLTVLGAPWNSEEFRAMLRSEILTVGVRTVAHRFVYEQTELRRRASSYDLLYCPANFAPLRKSHTPTVLTMQNAHYFGAGRRLAHNSAWMARAKAALARASTMQATLVVAISEALATEMSDDGIPRDRIRVVPSGRPEWGDVAAIAPSADVRPYRYVLAVASDDPHKRLDDLVLAWTAAAAPSAEALDLVIAGTISAEGMARQHALAPHMPDRQLVHLGNVTERSVMRWLYEHARACVVTSELEAYPLVPEEAGTNGCPLIVSDIPAHREVAGGHATFFDVADVSHLAEILRALPPHDRRPWARSWTWADNARAMAAVFDEAIAIGNRS